LTIVLFSYNLKKGSQEKVDVRIRLQKVPKVSELSIHLFSETKSDWIKEKAIGYSVLTVACCRVYASLKRATTGHPILLKTYSPRRKGSTENSVAQTPIRPWPNRRYRNKRGFYKQGFKLRLNLKTELM